MKTIKTFEEHAIVNNSELGNNWSADYHINIRKGNKPYIKKNEFYEEVDIKKAIPKNAIWLKPEKAKKLNDIGKEINQLKEEQNKILKNN